MNVDEAVVMWPLLVILLLTFGVRYWYKSWSFSLAVIISVLLSGFAIGAALKSIVVVGLLSNYPVPQFLFSYTIWDQLSQEGIADLRLFTIELLLGAIGLVYVAISALRRAWITDLSA